jgi:hypothetical protein
MMLVRVAARRDPGHSTLQRFSAKRGIAQLSLFCGPDVPLLNWIARHVFCFVASLDIACCVDYIWQDCEFPQLNDMASDSRTSE